MTDELYGRIEQLLKEKEYLILAIDGRCGAGKTTLAEKISERFDCSVIHMDDFFLQPFQRTQERLSAPGGNIDYERFEREVLIPLREKRDFSYRKFNCKKDCLDEEVFLKKKRLNIIEGSYSCHDRFRYFYDFTIFADVEKNLQLDRLLKREGEEKLQSFIDKWIPMEESYFKYFDIKNKCDLIYE